MTNGEKYKTESERMRAFNKVCGPCEKVKCDRCHALECFNAWLDDEAEEEKPLPCPFCGGDTVMRVYMAVDKKPAYKVACYNCYAESCVKRSRDEAIAAYNIVASAVLAAKESKAK